MGADERFDESISSWLARTAPGRLPDRTLEATFERTRRTRQQAGWRGLRGWTHMIQFAPALGGAAVVVVAAALALNFAVLPGIRGPSVGGPSPSSEAQSAFVGTWFSTSDRDGGTQTMTVRAPQAGAVEIVVTDDIASVCSRTPSTMKGTGRLEGDAKLVIPLPIYTCDDGGKPQTLGGPPLQQQLRNLTYVYDARAETLTDNFGGIWLREGAAALGPAPRASGAEASQAWDTMWPQTSLEEVRRAQALADAGDPAYAWQVDPQLAGDDYGKWERLHNGQVELVDRFLREELGWEAYMQNVLVGGADYSLTDQRFLRCAPGRTNPLYPPQPDSKEVGESCAPTLDDLRYASVSLDLAQPDRQGTGGIWVVSGWRPTEPFAQVDPAVAEAQATGRLEKFLAARIAGRGAEGYVDVYADWLGKQVPLLYATTSGAPYERFEFERVAGPTWPYGGNIDFRIRLFAEDGTVVEQEIRSHWDGGVSAGIEGGLGMSSTTTENGKPVPMLFAQFDGNVTYSSPNPYSWDVGGDGRIDFTDPVVLWSECAQGPVPADAAVFAQAVIADPNFETTAPVAARMGGVEAVAIDVALSPVGRVCGAYRTDANRWIHALEPGKRLRLFLVDLPEGMSMRTLAVTVIAPEASFGRAVEAAKPIVDSIEFHAP